MILNEDHESVTDVMDIAVCISALSTPDLLNIGKIQRQFNINVNGPTQVKLYIRFLSNLFSTNRPTGPIRSSSRDVRVSVCLSVCLSPFHAIFLKC